VCAFSRRDSVERGGDDDEGDALEAGGELSISIADPSSPSAEGLGGGGADFFCLIVELMISDINSEAIVENTVDWKNLFLESS
jgi:hypothetical protein